jgi:hypothetical protein
MGLPYGSTPPAITEGTDNHWLSRVKQSDVSGPAPTQFLRYGEKPKPFHWLGVDADKDAE